MAGVIDSRVPGLTRDLMGQRPRIMSGAGRNEFAKGVQTWR